MTFVFVSYFFICNFYFGLFFILSLCLSVSKFPVYKFLFVCLFNYVHLFTIFVSLFFCLFFVFSLSLCLFFCIFLIVSFSYDRCFSLSYNYKKGRGIHFFSTDVRKEKNAVRNKKKSNSTLKIMVQILSGKCSLQS